MRSGDPLVCVEAFILGEEAERIPQPKVEEGAACLCVAGAGEVVAERPRTKALSSGKERDPPGAFGSWPSLHSGPRLPPGLPAWLLSWACGFSSPSEDCTAGLRLSAFRWSGCNQAGAVQEGGSEADRRRQGRRDRFQGWGLAPVNLYIRCLLPE